MPFEIPSFASLKLPPQLADAAEVRPGIVLVTIPPVGSGAVDSSGKLLLMLLLLLMMMMMMMMMQLISVSGGPSVGLFSFRINYSVGRGGR